MHREKKNKPSELTNFLKLESAPSGTQNLVVNGTVISKCALDQLETEGLCEKSVTSNPKGCKKGLKETPF